LEAGNPQVQNQQQVGELTPSGPSEEEPARVVALPVEKRAAGRDFAHLSDEALVALVARGDDEALGALYDRFSGLAYGLALRILRDRALAEDAVQEAFLAVWRTASKFSSERAKPTTWVLTLVHRRAVDLVRREERRRSDPLEVAPQAATEDTAFEAELRAKRRVVQEALRQLPDDQREALELAYYGGYTQSELAERLGQPLGTIKSRMFTGLRRLRDLLAESGFELEFG
jgi:RNA polymerase sigma-70 factor (ECF subfamily)